MIDYIYTDIGGITINEFFKNELLDFKAPVSLKTGELNPYNSNRNKGYRPRLEMEASYRRGKFIITNDRYINYSGSLHEYFTDGSNHSNFNYSSLFTVIKDLNKKFNINPHLQRLHNVEFGVNVTLPFRTKSFLDAVILFKGRDCERLTYKGRGYLLRFTLDQYELKIYDKGFQKKLPDNVLRFEVKVRTMEFLHSKGIGLRTSADFLNKNVLAALGDVLNDFFQRLTICPKINTAGLNNRERQLLKDGSNYRYWIALKEERRETYHYRLSRFDTLSKKYDPDKMKETVQGLITEKWQSLNATSQEEEAEVTRFLERLRLGILPILNAHESSESLPEITAQGSPTEIPDFTQFNTSNSVLIPVNGGTKKRQYCKSCGRDITNQKKGSVFCSEARYGSEAKRCRNRDSNPRNNYLRREVRIKSGGLLFEIDDFITVKRVPDNNRELQVVTS